MYSMFSSKREVATHLKNKGDDGVFSCWPPVRRLLIEKRLGELSDHLGMGLSIKPWTDEHPSVFTELLRRAVLKGGAKMDRPLQRMLGKAKCMLDAITYIDGKCDVPCDQDGPFCVWDFNNLVHESQPDSDAQVHVDSSKANGGRVKQQKYRTQ